MKFISDYLGHSQCDAIKGVFILMVFISHFYQYVSSVGGHIFIGVYAIIIIGQCMVAPFLFYSGYGVMESIKAKGLPYVNAMPVRRILATLINFDIAVILFIVVNLMLSRPLSAKQILLSLIGWESVGNSNWYIFVIIICYAIAYISTRFFNFLSIRIILFVSAMLVLFYTRPSWWYDTILCFLVGMIYSEYKVAVEKFIMSHWLTLFIVLCLLQLVLFYRCPLLYGLGSNIKAIVFVLVIVLFTMKYPIRLGAFSWLGQHIFPLYIYQRIPMVVLFTLDPMGFATWRMPVYMMISLLVTLAIATYYPKWSVKL